MWRDFDWFSSLFGFTEHGHEDVQEQLELLKDGVMRSKANGKEYRFGDFSTPSLDELREKARAPLAPGAVAAAAPGLQGPPRVRQVLGDVANLHAHPDNCFATFQVASQFNCLEFVGPECTPEMGVAGYAWDRTQGPCCSIACGAATVYRNYFVELTGKDGGKVLGQRRDLQVENLRDLCEALENNPPGRFFVVQGGYTLADHDRGLRALNKSLHGKGEKELDILRGKLRVGVQDQAEVTSYGWGKNLLGRPDQVVTQVFGSACSVSYSRNGMALWEPFARLVLEASYEATLLVAAVSAVRHRGMKGSRRVFLTALGGGAFGNSMQWVEDAARRAIEKVCVKRGIALEVYLVSYDRPDRSFQALVDHFPDPAPQSQHQLMSKS